MNSPYPKVEMEKDFEIARLEQRVKELEVEVARLKNQIISDPELVRKVVVRPTQQGQEAKA